MNLEQTAKEWLEEDQMSGGSKIGPVLESYLQALRIIRGLPYLDSDPAYELARHFLMGVEKE